MIFEFIVAALFFIGMLGVPTGLFISLKDEDLGDLIAKISFGVGFVAALISFSYEYIVKMLEML